MMKYYILLIAIFVFAILPALLLYKKEKSIWFCANWLIAVMALIISGYNLWDSIETKGKDEEIKLEKILDESWDLLGGKEGNPNKPSKEINPRLKLDDRNIIAAERKINEARIISPNNPKVIKMEGELLLVKGEYKKALERFELSISKDPKYASAYGGMAQCYAYLGKIKDAIDAQKIAVELEPTSAMNLQNLGTSYLADNQMKLAIKNLEESLNIKPNNVTALMYLGIALYSNGDKFNGFKKIEKAIEIDPKNALLHYHLGLLRYDANQTEVAIKSFKNAINIEPSYSLALYNLGNCLFKLGNYQLAKKYYEQVIYLDPTFPDAYKRLELVSIKMGDTKEAMIWCRKAKEHGYDTKGIKVGRFGGLLKNLQK